MSSYNHDRFIGEAIDSVLCQSFSDFELIIIDDASGDSSRQVVDSFMKKDKRIKAIFHEKNLGIAKTYNDGIAAAIGKFIAFISSDDVWAPDKLEKQLDIMNKNDDLVVYSDGEIIDGQGSPTGKKFSDMYPAHRKSGYIFDELLKANFIFGSSLFLKKKNIDDIRFNENFRFINDYQFEIDMAKKYHYYFIYDCLAKYRIHGSNSILSDRKLWEIDMIDLRKYLLKKYDKDISARQKASMYHCVIRSYRDLGDKRNMRRFLYRAIITDPVDPFNMFFLILIMTKIDNSIRNMWPHLTFLKSLIFSPTCRGP